MKRPSPTPCPLTPRPAAHGSNCLHCQAVARAKARAGALAADPRPGRVNLAAGPVEAVKANAFGSDITSPIPKPRGRGPGSRATNRRENPRLFPWEKPIRVNTRDIHRELRRYTDPTEKRLARWLYSTWNAQAEAIKYQELENARRTGELSASTLASWRQDYSRFVNETLAPEWRNGIEDGADYMAGRVADALGVEWHFPETTKRLDAWIADRGAVLTVDLSDEQEAAVRNILGRSLVDQGLSPVELGKRLRPVVGLTEVEAGYVENRRAQLAKLVAEGKLKPGRAEFLTGRYSDFLLRRRATRIARTETAFAFNFGALEGMREAVAEGLISGDKVRKTFSTSDDERVCSFCEPLDGQTVGLEETFPGATERLPNTLVPPVHPNCRCCIEYEIIDDVRKPKVNSPLPEGIEEVNETNIDELENQIRSVEPGSMWDRLMQHAGDRAYDEQHFSTINAIRYASPSSHNWGGEGARAFVARDVKTGQIQGALAWRPRPDLDAFELHGLGSLERGSGVGSKLLDQLVRETATRERSLIFEANPSQRPFFTKYGIKPPAPDPIDKKRLRYFLSADDVKTLAAKRRLTSTSGVEFVKPPRKPARERVRVVAPAPPRGPGRVDVEAFEDWVPVKTKKAAVEKVKRHFADVKITSAAEKALGGADGVTVYLNLIDAEIVRLKNAGLVPSNIRMRTLHLTTAGSKRYAGMWSPAGIHKKSETTSEFFARIKIYNQSKNARELFQIGDLSIDIPNTFYDTFPGVSGEIGGAKIPGKFVEAVARRAERELYDELLKYEYARTLQAPSPLAEFKLGGKTWKGKKFTVSGGRASGTLRHELGHALSMPVEAAENRSLAANEATTEAFRRFRFFWLKYTNNVAYAVDTPLVENISVYSGQDILEFFAEAFDLSKTPGFVPGSLDAKFGVGFEASIDGVVQVLVGGGS